MDREIFADLHNHTTCSDGDFTPEEMVQKAKEKEIPVIGITDHDTLEGLEHAVRAGQKYKVTVIPGVEVSVRFKRSNFTGTLHLLCYFDPDLLENHDFCKVFNSILTNGRGEKLVRARIDEINKIFGPGGEKAALQREMNFEDISKLSDNATRRHFALALDKTFGIGDKQQINAIIGNDSPAYLPSGIELSEMGNIIGKYPMVTSLAHPAAGSYPGEGHYKEVLPPVDVVEQILPEFLDIGINGIEAYYPGHTPEHEQLIVQWSQRHNLVLTGGSDCHDKSERPFGVQGLTKEEFRKFEKLVSLNRNS